MRPSARLLPLLSLVLLCGCVDLSDYEEVSHVFEEIGKSKVTDLLWDSTRYAVLGGVVGGVLGLIAFFGLRAAGAYTWKWKYAWPFRGLTCLLVMAGFTLSGSVIGLGQGFMHGIETVLRKSQLATEAFPALGDLGADFTYSAAFVADAFAEGAEKAPDKDAALSLPPLDAFRAGTVEVNIHRLLNQAEAVPDALAKAAAKLYVDELLDARPEWKGTKFQTLSEAVVSVLAKYLFKKKATEEIRKLTGKIPGVEKALQKVIDGLEDAAAAEGDPETMSRTELSEYYVQRGLIPVLLSPIRSIVRAKQALFSLVALAALVCPALCFLLAETLRKRRASVAPEAEAEAPSDAAPEDSEPDPPPQSM